MGTNLSTPVPQCATLIGCSNKTLAQLIRDKTGIRRFVELTFSANPDRDIINSLNFTTAWHCEDENGPDPILPHLAELLAQQQAARHRSSVEQWLDAINEAEGAHIVTDMGRTVARKETVHRQYTRWREENGFSDRTVDPYPAPNQSPCFAWCTKAPSAAVIAQRDKLRPIPAQHPGLTMLCRSWHQRHNRSPP